MFGNWPNIFKPRASVSQWVSAECQEFDSFMEKVPLGKYPAEISVGNLSECGQGRSPIRPVGPLANMSYMSNKYEHVSCAWPQNVACFPAASVNSISATWQCNKTTASDSNATARKQLPKLPRVRPWLCLALAHFLHSPENCSLIIKRLHGKT